MSIYKYVVGLFLALLVTMVGITNASPLSYTPPLSVTIEMYRLNLDGSIWVDQSTGNPAPCSSFSTVYGCTAFVGSWTYRYPYGYDNPVSVPIETDYLLDVVSQEMGAIPFNGEARHAQAVVARSFAYHHSHFDSHTGTPTMNNSTASQVFIPYRWEKWDAGYHFSGNSGNPCYYWWTDFLPQQKLICTAVDASKDYVTGINNIYDLPDTPLFGSNAPALTQFFGDTPDATVTESSIVPGTTRHTYPYLVGVADSISSDPGVGVNGHEHGMSQNGASRWGHGNMGWQGDLGEWSVKWSRDQILVHYYTRINLRDQSGSRVTPDYRWNPLEINWGTSDRQPPTMVHGNSYPITIRIQNTGVYDWSCSQNGYQDFDFQYKWTKDGQTAIGSNSISVCNQQTGDPSPSYSLTIGGIPNWGEGTYGLHFDIDVDAANPDGDFDFSHEGWPTYTFLMCVGSGTCGDVFLPIVIKSE